MKLITVKAYAELIGKSEKTVYKMIKNETIDAMRHEGKYRISVDKNLIKVIDRTQRALEEAKAVLTSIEAQGALENSVSAEKPTVAAAAVPKHKKTAPKPKMLKKSVKKTVSKKPPKKSSTKKR